MNIPSAGLIRYFVQNFTSVKPLHMALTTLYKNLLKKIELKAFLFLNVR